VVDIDNIIKYIEFNTTDYVTVEHLAVSKGLFDRF